MILVLKDHVETTKEKDEDVITTVNDISLTRLRSLARFLLRTLLLTSRFIFIFFLFMAVTFRYILCALDSVLVLKRIKFFTCVKCLPR